MVNKKTSILFTRVRGGELGNAVMFLDVHKKLFIKYVFFKLLDISMYKLNRVWSIVFFLQNRLSKSIDKVKYKHYGDVNFISKHFTDF